MTVDDLDRMVKVRRMLKKHLMEARKWSRASRNYETRIRNEGRELAYRIAIGIVTRDLICDCEVLPPANERTNPRRKRVRVKRDGQPNGVVKCECGCGSEFMKYDGKGNLRRYLPGHNIRMRYRATK